MQLYCPIGGLYTGQFEGSGIQLYCLIGQFEGGIQLYCLIGQFEGSRIQLYCLIGHFEGSLRALLIRCPCGPYALSYSIVLSA